MTNFHNNTCWDEEFNTAEYIKGLFELAETQGLYQDLGREIGKLVDQKQLAYGDSTRVCTEVLKVFLQRYKNEDSTYTIPESLLHHIFLQVRIIDKQGRIFANPDGDLMGENPYADLTGYSLLGNHYVDKLSRANG